METFKPISGNLVKIYTCGPTVYDRAHLGNLRTFIFEDILTRALKYNGYKIKQIMNITDIDDKIIKRAAKENKKIFEITEPFTEIFFSDIKKLNIKKASFYPKAANHIKEIISLIEKLIKNKTAYRGTDGSIYFNISGFKNYGRLSRLKKRKIKIGARIAADEYNKNQAQDFVLWKRREDNEPSWPSPWGNGRPGWHIECSAMSMKYLGETLDIHAGGIDLIFPHHENEIAQSEAATGKKFAGYWIHGEHLLIHGQKMAKSLGNFYTLQDIENRSFNPVSFRYLILTSRYRSKMNFTWNSLKSAQNALNNLIRGLQTANYNDKPERKIKNETETTKTEKYEKQFLSAINDDLNTPKAVSLVWKIIKDPLLFAKTKKRLIKKFDAVLGLDLTKTKPAEIPQKIKELATQREKLRNNQQFILADRLRKKIEKLGYLIEDTTAGPKIKKIKI